jgi:hypothetical protein
MKQQVLVYPRMLQKGWTKEFPQPCPWRNPEDGVRDVFDPDWRTRERLQGLLGQATWQPIPLPQPTINPWINPWIQSPPIPIWPTIPPAPFTWTGTAGTWTGTGGFPG